MAKVRPQSALLQIVGDSPRTRVLDFLLTHAGFDYSKTQVAREAGISRITINGIWQELEKQGMIARTRKMGNAELYALDVGNAHVKALAQLDYALAKAKSEKEFERHMAKAEPSEKSWKSFENLKIKS